jgi:hypothetical protein
MIKVCIKKLKRQIFKNRVSISSSLLYTKTILLSTTDPRIRQNFFPCIQQNLDPEHHGRVAMLSPLTISVQEFPYGKNSAHRIYLSLEFCRYISEIG